LRIQFKRSAEDENEGSGGKEIVKKKGLEKRGSRKRGSRERGSRERRREKGDSGKRGGKKGR
jgi:hypothetical protein